MVDFHDFIQQLRRPDCEVKFFQDKLPEFLQTRNINDLDSERGYSLLHYAAFYGKDDVVEFLIDNGADVNARNEWDHTPLHVAARYNNAKACALLIQAGADSTAQTHKGKTPFQLAEERLRKEDYDPLIDFLPMFSFHIAAEKGQISVLEELWLHGQINNKVINSQDKNGDTALHTAAKAGLLEVVRWLAQKHLGADLNKINKAGQTPLAVARGKGKVDVEKELLQAKAKRVALTSSESALLAALTTKEPDWHAEVEKAFAPSVTTSSLAPN